MNRTISPIQHLEVKPYFDKYLGDWCFKFHNISPVQARIIRGIMTANHYDDPSYQIKHRCHPFLEGYDDNRPGDWVMVSIATKDVEKVTEFCQYVEKLINDPTQHSFWKEL